VTWVTCLQHPSTSFHQPYAKVTHQIKVLAGGARKVRAVAPSCIEDVARVSVDVGSDVDKEARFALQNVSERVPAVVLCDVLARVPRPVSSFG
jgi:hypothetical protein